VTRLDFFFDFYFLVFARSHILFSSFAVSAAANDEEVALDSFSDDDDDANATTATTTTTTTTTAQQRLFNARLRLNEARKRNHQQVLDEAKRARTDADAAARERRRQWLAKQAELTADAEARGLSAERAKLLHTTAFAAERSAASKKARRAAANDDFADDDDADTAHFEWDLFNENTHARHHQKLVAAHLAKSGAPAPNDNAGADADAAADIDAAAALDPTLNPALLRSSAPRTLALNKLVDVLHAGAEKRAQFSRRRTEHEEADVDYINAKNKTFNKKLAKAYDAYSADIRQSLERGSAI
jgi:pre-mRNA-splicing factor SYF2